MFCRNNFVKGLLTFVIIIFGLIGTNVLSAGFSFDDFPQLAAGYDISVDYSELGKDYVKVKMNINQHENNFAYQLYYKEYDKDLNLIKSNTTNVQNLSLFHFQVSTMHFYDFCVVAYDQFGQIVANTSVERVVPGQFINRPKNRNGHVSLDHQSAKNFSTIQADGLETSLEIGHDSFPYISCLSEVKLNGLPFDGDPNNNPLLTESNFSITEDGRLQIIREFVLPETSGGGSSRIADIVFVHDDSGSLGDEAAQVKQNIQAFVNQLNNSNIDYRVGLLPYGGSCGSNSFSCPEGTILNNGILYSSASDFILDLDQMRFYGGTEKAFCAMQKAAQNIAWRPSTQKSIILITDENNDSGCINQVDVTSLLQNANIRVYALTRGHQEFTDIANATGGNRFNITADFTSILNEIGEDIANKYWIQYETDNKNQDGQTRIVELTVAVNDGQGGTLTSSVTGTYTLTAPIVITLTPETEKHSLQGQRQQSPITIVAKITQGQSSFNGQAALYYTNRNLSSYVPVGMTSIGNDLFSATIPAGGVGEPSVRYYISATDGNVTSTMPSVDQADDPMVISVLPNSAPIITHTPVTSVPEGQDINAYGRVEDATNMVAKVAVHYRSIGSALYSSISDTPNKETVEYQFTIPGSNVTGSGLEYYVYAEDDHGVSSTFGTPDNPIQVFVTSQGLVTGQKDIGNLTVYADSFIQNLSDNNLWTASGNVMIGTAGGYASPKGNPILSVGTSLLMHYDTNIVEGLSSGTLIALDIKKNRLKDPENIPLYYGQLAIDCSSYPLNITMDSGESRLKLIGNILLFFTGQPTITFDDTKVVLQNIAANITQGINVFFNIGDIVLSQVGDSTGEVTVGYLGNTPPALQDAWNLPKLEAQFDFIKSKITGTSEFDIPGLLAIEDASVTLGFLTDPFALETVGIKIGAGKFLPQIPPTSPVGIKWDYAALTVDRISTMKALTITGDVGMRLSTNPVDVPLAVHHFTGRWLVSGNVVLLIDLSGKLELSGAIDLLELITLASGKMGMIYGNPVSFYVQGDMDLLDTLIGHVYFNISGYQGTVDNTVEIVGENLLTLQISDKINPFSKEDIVLLGQAVDVLIRLKNGNIEKAEFAAGFKYYFIEVGFRLDFSDPSDPDLYITGWNREFQVFNVSAKSKGSFGIVSLKNITIDTDSETVIVRVTSDQDAALFNITFPDGTTYTPANATPLVPPDDPRAQNIGDIFFIRNVGKHISYYAIKNPPKGTYQLEVANDTDIGNYTVRVLGPNSKPTITIDSQTADSIWDGASPINIVWKADDSDDNPDISLYFDSDNFGNDGNLIVDGLKEEDAVNSYQWNIGSKIQSGSYYIYARIDDGENAPMFAYSKGKIQITNSNAPAEPQNVIVTEQDGSLKVEWDANIEENIRSYVVYIGDDLGNKYDFKVGLNTTYEIQGLENGKLYAISVSAVNTDALESNLAFPIFANPNGTGLGGSPDLMVEIENSSITSNSSMLEDLLTVQIRVKNIGVHESYSAKIYCYYGSMSESNLIDNKLIGNIAAGDYLDVIFELDTTTLADKLESRYFYIRISDVVLPELETGNNMAVIENNLPFEHTINLTSGWNLISFTAESADCTISKLLAPIAGKFASVWSFSSNGWEVYDPQNAGFSDLSCMEPGNGYWINMTDTASLTITGITPTRSVDLNHGWNLIGINSLNTFPIADALASIQGKYVAVWEYKNGSWKVYDPSQPGFSDLNTIEPGRGYWIATTEASTWTLP